VLAVVAALGVAFRHTPSFASTARTVDAHFRLDDCAATALQFSDAQDPASRLVVVEASSRLRAMSPSLLPLGGSASTGWASLATIATSILIVFVLAGSDSPPASGSGTGTASNAAAGRRSTPAQPARAGGAAARGETTATTEAPSSAAATQVSGRNEQPRTREGGAARPEGQRTGADASATNSADNRSGTAQPSAAPAPATSARQPSTTGTSGSGRDASAGVTGRGAERARSGAGRGGNGIASNGAAAGGISGGAVVTSAAVTPVTAQPVSTTFDTPAYRSAYARAEAAVSDQRIPPRLRSYVRDYFVAIRPRADQ